MNCDCCYSGTLFYLNGLHKVTFWRLQNSSEKNLFFISNMNSPQ